MKLKMPKIELPAKKLPAPYIKLYKTVNGIDCYIIDGSYVRREMNDQFTNFGQHYRFPFIPTNEFWLDQQHGHKEYKYYIDHLLKEHELMKRGRSYAQAIDAGDRVEQRERIIGDNKQLLNERLLKTVNGIRICLINGESARDIYDIDFTAGGHDLIYDWVPPKTIYIDDTIPESEREFVLLHEVGEYNGMAKDLQGKGKVSHEVRIEIYNKEHNKISKVEREARKKPTIVAGIMKQEYAQLGNPRKKKFGLF